MFKWLRKLLDSPACPDNGEFFNQLPHPSKAPPMPPVKPARIGIMVNQLIVKFLDGSTAAFETDWEAGRKNINEPWLHFYKWYLNRQGSPAYVMKLADQELMLKRDFITQFQVIIVEK